MKNRVCENYGTKKHVPDSVPKIGNNVSILVGNKTTKKTGHTVITTVCPV